MAVGGRSFFVTFVLHGLNELVDVLDVLRAQLLIVNLLLQEHVVDGTCRTQELAVVAPHLFSQGSIHLANFQEETIIIAVSSKD